MSKQGSEKKEFALGVSNYPHPSPDLLPPAFQELLYCLPTTQTAGRRESQQMFEKKEVRKGHNAPQQKQSSSEKKKQCIIGRSPGSAVGREGLGAPVFQKTAGPLRTQNLNLEDLGVFNDGSGFPATPNAKCLFIVPHCIAVK